MTTHQHPSGRHDHDADAHRDGAATAVLEVSGVQWATSKNVAEAVLSRQPGVISVDANPIAQTATVTYDPKRTSMSCGTGSASAASTARRFCGRRGFGRRRPARCPRSRSGLPRSGPRGR